MKYDRSVDVHYRAGETLPDPSDREQLEKPGPKVHTIYMWYIITCKFLWRPTWGSKYYFLALTRKTSVGRSIYSRTRSKWLSNQNYFFFMSLLQQNIDFLVKSYGFS